MPQTSMTPAKIRSFAIDLQRRNSDSLGFLPKMAFLEYQQRGQLLPATENGELAAYAIFYDGRKGNRPRAHPDTIKIHQLCTQYDARLLKHATSIVNQIYDHARTCGFLTLQAWVADDIPANDFWKTIGFTHTASRSGGDRRNRTHNLWTLDIEPTPQPAAPTFSNPNDKRPTYYRNGLIATDLTRSD